MRKLTFSPITPGYGLHLLVAVELGRHAAIDRVSTDTKRPLRKHPLGLELPRGTPFGNWAFVSGATNLSVDAMKAHLNWVIGGVADVSAIERLRVFNVQHDPKRPNEHFCFFEVWTPFGVFFCGDCTDYSGAGRVGNRNLRAIYSFLGLVYGREIEEFEVRYGERHFTSIHTLDIPNWDSC